MHVNYNSLVNTASYSRDVYIPYLRLLAQHVMPTNSIYKQGNMANSRIEVSHVDRKSVPIKATPTLAHAQGKAVVIFRIQYRV
jgi:hypothetical protein